MQTTNPVGYEYWSGYDDYKRGRHFADNPYNYDTSLSLHLMWGEGYLSAYQDVMKKIEAIGDQARGPERPPPAALRAAPGRILNIL